MRLGSQKSQVFRQARSPSWLVSRSRLPCPPLGLIKADCSTLKSGIVGSTVLSISQIRHVSVMAFLAYRACGANTLRGVSSYWLRVRLDPVCPASWLYRAGFSAHFHVLDLDQPHSIDHAAGREQLNSVSKEVRFDVRRACWAFGFGRQRSRNGRAPIVLSEWPSAFRRDSDRRAFMQLKREQE